MEIHELAAMVEKRLDCIEEKIDRLWDADGHQKEDCRARHTELDRNVERLKERGRIGAYIIFIVATAVAATVSWVQNQFK